MKEFAQQFLELLGVSLAALCATVCGVAGGHAFVREVTPRQRVAVSLSGIGLGCYGSAAAASWFKLDTAFAAGTGFALGFLSFPLLAFAFGFVNRLARRSDSIADRAADKVLGPGGTTAPDKENPQ